MLCSNLLGGLIVAILSLSLSCDSYGKNYASKKECEMATQDDDDVPFPRSRPYNPLLHPSDPGNERALRAGEQDEDDGLYSGINPLPRPDPRKPPAQDNEDNEAVQARDELRLVALRELIYPQEGRP
jgi:hypothetical protein